MALFVTGRDNFYLCPNVLTGKPLLLAIFLFFNLIYISVALILQSRGIILSLLMGACKMDPVKLGVLTV